MLRGRGGTVGDRSSAGGAIGCAPCACTSSTIPWSSHKLTVLRDRETDSPTFRRLADELVTLLAYEATRGRPGRAPRHRSRRSRRPPGCKLSAPKPLVVPILRAGLGMLDGMTRLVPTAEVGFLGMIRDEHTLQASTYATRLPDDLSGRQVFLLDPMLATGGTLTAAMHVRLRPRRRRRHRDLPAGRPRGRRRGGADASDPKRL